MVLATGFHSDIRKEHFHNQQNIGEISPGNLRCDGLRESTGVDIFETCDKNMGYAFTGVEKLLWKTSLPCLLFGK